MAVLMLQVEQLRAELSNRSGSGALAATTPTAPSAAVAEAGSPLAAGQNGSLEVIAATDMHALWRDLLCF